jgi:hypothetical protein
MRQCIQLIRASRCHRFYSRPASASSTRQIQILENGSVEAFRNEAFGPAIPRRLPLGSLSFPAVHKWFTLPTSTSSHVNLNANYFEAFGGSTVPLEMIDKSKEGTEAFFQTIQSPLQYFVKWIQDAEPDSSIQLYLAQAYLSDLPQALRDDIPTPDVVLRAGKGDVYASSLWMGLPPTYTPLHRDPNPNLFVQLAGQKTVRLFNPEIGTEIFNGVQKRLDRNASAFIRGEEMMSGEERSLLEEVVWNTDQTTSSIQQHLYEASLCGGDALFIPKGWWHSIKGRGNGVNASVSLLVPRKSSL